MMLLSRLASTRISRIIRLLLPALALLAFKPAVAQTSGAIDGLVRDINGAAMPGLSLTLAADGSPAPSVHTATDRLGAYHFSGLAPGVYRLSTDPPGYTLLSQSPLTISAQTPALRLDVTVSDTRAQENPAMPQGLQLQAAGIRGYIDPGGYSAPAGAAAASDLIQGAAGLNRGADTLATLAAASNSACSRQHALLKAVTEHPEDAAAQRQLGEAYLAAHEPEKALAVLERAWALDNPDKHDTAIQASLAEALLLTKRFAQSRDLLTGSIPRPQTAAFHRLLARSQEGLGAFQQASLEYQAAAALEPTEADFYGAGYEQILAGVPRAAADFFEAGVKRYPESTTLLTGIGTAEFLEGRTAEATRIFLRVATLHPSDPRVYPFLSASFAIAGVEAPAVEASFQRYYERSPKSAEAAYLYAVVLLHRSPENADKAEALLRRAVVLDPNLAQAHLQLGSLSLGRRNYAEAAEQLAAALRLDPTLTEVHYKLAAAYRRTRQTSLAEQQMQLFLASKHDDPSGRQLSEIHVERFLSVFAEQRSTPAAESVCGAQD